MIYTVRVTGCIDTDVWEHSFTYKALSCLT